MFGFFKRKPDGPPSTKEALARYKRGDFAGALRCVDELIAQVPEVALSHRFRGEALFELGRYDEAIRAFERAEELGGPGTDEVFFWRALAHGNAGRTTDAFRILNEYIASGSDPAMMEKCQAAIQAFGGTG